MWRDILQEHPHRGGTIGSTLVQRGIRKAAQHRASIAAQAPCLGINLSQ
jgi:hypothetical protein